MRANTENRGKSRRLRSDSAAVAIERFHVERTLNIDPLEHDPVHPEAMPFWKAIINGRAKEEWTAAPALLSTATSLAWVQWQIVKYRQLAAGEIEMDGATMSQVCARLSDLQKLEMSYLRILQQHGRAVQGEARDLKKRRALAIQDRNLEMEDDLIARPN